MASQKIEDAIITNNAWEQLLRAKTNRVLSGEYPPAAKMDPVTAFLEKHGAHIKSYVDELHYDGDKGDKDAVKLEAAQTLRMLMTDLQSDSEGFFKNNKDKAFVAAMRKGHNPNSSATYSPYYAEQLRKAESDFEQLVKSRLSFRCV